MEIRQRWHPANREKKTRDEPQGDGACAPAPHATATNGYEYSDEEAALITAVAAYRQRTGRTFPTICEILAILKQLGYRKGDPPVEPPLIEAKRCKTCCQVKPLETGFWRAGGSSHQSSCRDCMRPASRDKSRIRRQSNRKRRQDSEED